MSGNLSDHGRFDYGHHSMGYAHISIAQMNQKMKDFTGSPSQRECPTE